MIPPSRRHTKPRFHSIQKVPSGKVWNDRAKGEAPGKTVLTEVMRVNRKSEPLQVVDLGGRLLRKSSQEIKRFLLPSIGD